eukprot:4593167-Alexandrium_andersonii.AAC.1
MISLTLWTSRGHLRANLRSPRARHTQGWTNVLWEGGAKGKLGRSVPGRSMIDDLRQSSGEGTQPATWHWRCLTPRQRKRQHLARG